MTHGQQPARGPAGPGGPAYGWGPAAQGPPPAGHAAAGYHAAGSRRGDPHGGGYGAHVPYGAPPAPSSPYGPPQPYDSGRQYGIPPAYGPPAPVHPPAGRRRRAPMPVGGPVSDEDERWAVPAYVGIFVSGFVAPAVVYLAKGRSSPFARFHAVQALNLWIAMTVCDLAVYVLMYVIGFTGLFIALAVVAVEFFCVIKAAMGANRREWYRLPAIAAWPILR